MRSWARPTPDKDAVDLTSLADFPWAYSDEGVFCTLLADAFVDRACWHIVSDFTDEARGGVPQGGGIPDRVTEPSAGAWRWLTRRLDARGWLETSADADLLRLAPAASDAEYDRMLATARAPGDPMGAAAMVDLYELAASAYPGYLTGETDGESVLLGRDSVALWQRYFDNSNAHYAIVNRIAAEVLAADIGDPTVPVAVAEVGGGFGSACAAVLERTGTAIGSYLFSERVPFFLMHAKRTLAALFPHRHDTLRFERIDIEKSLPEQGLADGSVDAVLAVNVLHAVADLGDTLMRLRRALRAGGRLLLGEALELAEPIAPAFVFQMTKPFQEFEPAPYRTRGGFLRPDEWRQALAAAGFESVRMTPDPDDTSHLDPPLYLSVIEARVAEDAASS